MTPLRPSQASVLRVALLLLITVNVTPHGQSSAGFPLLAGTARGPTGTLAIQQGAFTVDGQKKFLLFLSYFGALRDALWNPQHLVDIFNSARLYGFDGVRVLPNWWRDTPDLEACTNQDPNPLMLGNGWINTAPIAGLPAIPAGAGSPKGYDNSVAGRFLFLLDVAWEKGLVVDVSFAPEPVDGLDRWNAPDRKANLAEYREGLKQVALALRTLTYPGNGTIAAQTGYPHAFFDLANEFNYGKGCKPAFSESEILSLAKGVKEGDPKRLVTASIAGSLEPDAAWEIVNDAGLDIIAYHEPRESIRGNAWGTMADTWLAGDAAGDRKGWRQLTRDAVPILFQEPERHRYLPESSCDQNAPRPSGHCTDNYTEEQFLIAIRTAKQSGAAGWTFHTQRLFRFASDYAPGLSTVETGVLNRVRSGELNVPR